MPRAERRPEHDDAPLASGTPVAGVAENMCRGAQEGVDREAAVAEAAEGVEGT